MSQKTVGQAITEAVAHHQAGRLNQAELIYRQILAAVPNHPDALHLLGLIAHDVGKQDVAEGLVKQAIAIAPGQVHYHNSLG